MHRVRKPQCFKLRLRLFPIRLEHLRYQMLRTPLIDRICFIFVRAGAANGGLTLDINAASRAEDCSRLQHILVNLRHLCDATYPKEHASKPSCKPWIQADSAVPANMSNEQRRAGLVSFPTSLCTESEAHYCCGPGLGSFDQQS